METTPKPAPMETKTPELMLPLELRGLTIWEAGRTGMSLASVNQHERHAKAKAAFIVRAVNSHSALVKALEPFAKLADQIDAFGHEAGSTCTHRIAADDLFAARTAYLAALASKE